MNNRRTEEIYNLIEDIQNKLMKSQQVNKYINRNTISNNNPFLSNDNQFIFRNQKQNMSLENNRYMNYNPINPNQSQSFIPNNLNNNTPNEFEIRKIIKDEFNQLISSFQFSMDNTKNELDIKINEITKDCYNIKNEQKNLNDIYKNMLNNNNGIIDFKIQVDYSLKEMKQLLLNHVTKNEFESKNNEIQEQINFTKNNINIESKSGTEISNKLTYEISNINQKIQGLNITYENMKNKLDNLYDNYNNDINEIKNNNNKILSNEIKINDIDSKNNIYQKKLDEYYQDLNKFKNEIKLLVSSNNSKMNEINDKLNAEKQNYINKNLDNMKNINDNLNNELNTINKEIDQMKEKIRKLDLINLEHLNKFDNNKIDTLSEEFENNKKRYPKIFELLEQHEVSINDTNTKLEKLNNDYEKEIKKIFNNLNERKKDLDLINRRISDMDKRIYKNELDIKNNAMSESGTNIIRSINDHSPIVIKKNNIYNPNDQNDINSFDNNKEIKYPISSINSNINIISSIENNSDSNNNIENEIQINNNKMNEENNNSKKEKDQNYVPRGNLPVAIPEDKDEDKKSQDEFRDFEVVEEEEKEN